MTSPESYTSYNEELKQLWGNKSFAYSIAAKVYEGTIGKLQDSPVIETKTFLHCIVEHLICNGQIKTANYTNRCFCPCHRFAQHSTDKEPCR